MADQIPVKYLLVVPCKKNRTRCWYVLFADRDSVESPEEVLCDHSADGEINVRHHTLVSSVITPLDTLDIIPLGLLS